jgi:hypothetical protein
MEHERRSGHDALESASTTISPSVTLTVQEPLSDSNSSPVAVAQTVMAEQVTNDVVKEAQSMGRPAPIDDTASATNTSAASGEQPSGPATTDPKSSDAPSPSDSTNATTPPTDSASAAADEKPSANGDALAATVSAKDTSVRICAKHYRPRTT